MKGRIELYYDMPHLEAYLEASGANYDGSILKDVLDEFMKEAVLHHVEENKFTIMGTLNNFLENKELFCGSRELFRRLPKATEDIFSIPTRTPCWSVRITLSKRNARCC